MTPAYSWPADRFSDLLTEAGLVPFARLFHDPASERGFLDAHLLACLGLGRFLQIIGSLVDVCR